MFEPMPKIPRLNRDMIITEKIDGTNAQVWIDVTLPEDMTKYAFKVDFEGINFFMAAGSRTRFLTEKEDNYGFFKWVLKNREELAKLGPGTHFGEWWGQGVNRGYGLTEKRFSLFNVGRWTPETAPACCHVVPILCQWTFDTGKINQTLHDLAETGSIAAPGFMNPEGIVVFHTAAQNLFKVTIKDDEKPKGQVK